MTMSLTGQLGPCMWSSHEFVLFFPSKLKPYPVIPLSQYSKMGFKLFKRTNSRIRTIRRSLSRRLSRRDRESEHDNNDSNRQEQMPEDWELRRNSIQIGTVLRQIGDELNNSRLSLNSSRLSLNLQNTSKN